jgi:hypothetical protein
MNITNHTYCTVLLHSLLELVRGIVKRFKLFRGQFRIQKQIDSVELGSGSGGRAGWDGKLGSHRYTTIFYS